MAWAKGQSGNPKGRLTEKLFGDALRLALHEEDKTSGKQKLRLIAEKVVDEAVLGQQWACQMVADRLDGKPVQSIEASVTDGADLRDLGSAELAARTVAALARLEELTGGDGGPAASPNGSAHVRKFN